MSQRNIRLVRSLIVTFAALALATGCPPEEPEAPPAPETPPEAPPAPDAPPEPPPAMDTEADEEPNEGSEDNSSDENDDADNDSADEDGEAEASGDEEAAAAGDGEMTDVGDMDELVACMKEKGVMIYGSVTCPFCTQLADKFGGAETVAPIYVECTQDGQRCRDEMLGRGVPEIQIGGEMYRESRDPAEIGRAAGCNLLQ